MKLIIISIFAKVVLPVWSLKPFGGQHLVLAGYSYPPYDLLIRHPDGNYSVKGSNMAVADWVLSRINLSYSILPVNDPQEIAKLGLFEASLTKLIAKQADAMVASLVIDPNRAARIDYTCGLGWAETYNIIVPKPEFQSRLFAFVRPFQFWVWVGLLMSVIVIIAMMVLFTWVYQKFRQSVVNKTPIATASVRGLSFYSIYVMNILTNHGDYTTYSQLSFRILAGGLLLASLVLVNSYSSIVMSSLTVPIRNPAVNSLQDLVDNKDVSLIIQKDVIIGTIILKAETGLYKILGDELRRHPDRMLMSYPLIFKLLEEGKYAFPFINSFNRNIIAKQYQKDGKCRLQLSDPIGVTTGSFLGVLQKGSKYTEAWSHALIELWETGLTNYWVEHVTANADVCFDKKPPKTTSKPKPIKLVDLTSAFLILGIGLGLGTICFVIEIVHNRLLKRFRV